MSRVPTVISTKSIYKNKYTEVKVDKLKKGDFQWEQVYFIKPNKYGVGILPIDDNGVFLVYQYRHASKVFLWQLPMGMIDMGKTELETAKHELLEEAGIKAKKFTRIGSVFAEPGVIYQEEIIYAAEGLTLTKNQPEKNEIGMRVKHFSYQELGRMIKNGELKCGFTLSALMFLNNNFFNGKNRF